MGRVADWRLPTPFRSLQRDHLLERKRNRGTFVAEPSIEEAAQLFEARRTLEQATIERVVERATEADLDQLEALNDEEKRLYDVDGRLPAMAFRAAFTTNLPGWAAMTC